MPHSQAKAEIHTEPIVGAGLSRFVQLGVYDPTKPQKPVAYYPQLFSRHGIDRAVMLRAITTFNDIVSIRPNDHRCMGIFPVIPCRNS